MKSLKKSFGKMFICSPECGPCIHPDYEPDTKRFLREYLEPGMVFFDIGAHVGLFSICAQQLGAKIHAFEAHPDNFKVLKANAKLYPGITPHQIAVWDKDEVLKLDADKPNAQAFIHLPKDGSRSFKVQGRALDNMTELPPPDFIKSDIQGAELMGLMGMKDRILPSVKFLQIEVYPNGYRRYGHTVQDLLAFLKEAGFKCISHSKRFLLTFDRIFVNAHFVRIK